MTSANKELCAAVEERLAEAIDGTLEGELATHVETCDDCRDRVHDAAFVIEELRALGGDHTPSSGLEERILSAIDARPAQPAKGEGASERVAAAVASAKRRRWSPPPASGLRTAGAALALAAAVTVGVVALRGPRAISTAAAPSAPWRGVVTRVSGPEGGLMIEEGGKTRAVRAGDAIAAGAKLRTDLRTRARITLDDGTFLVLDRGAELALDERDSRAARLVRGAVVVDATASDSSPAKVAMPGGALSTTGAKLSLSTLGQGTAVAVARGKASLRDGHGVESTLGVGEGASVGGGATLVRAGGLGAAFGWSEAVGERIDEPKPGDEASVPGLGVLRARLPGATGDGDKALRLTRQSVTVKIAGDFARTEIEEVFASDFDVKESLEGIFRFPLPPDAAIERLALEVDGHVEEGAFVDKDRGAAIWKGVLFHATPKPQPKPQEEFIWVPGPWRDPALLEWRAGGRMELRVFPIPPRGSRRVILAYTQRIAASGGARRYVYPLPKFGAATSAIDEFSLDVQVVGHDPQKGVQVHGYEAENAGDGGFARRALHKKGFLPSGDFVVELAKKDEGAAASTWAYQPAGGEKAFVALSLAPKIPRAPDSATRTHAIVIDSSRSMVGERWTRAAALAARVVEEMDPRDRFTLLACDVACTPLSVAAQTPGKAAADSVRTFLSSITPEGASDPTAAIRVASAHARGEPGRAARIIYVGDGAPTIGARTPAAIEASVRGTIGEATLTAVAIGVDADVASLDAMARGGGGAVIPYVAGQPLAAAALDVLEASYGVTLRDPVLELPAGLEAVAPQKIGAVRAGGEVFVVARMTGADVQGEAKLSGTLAGKPWSTSIPIAAHATSEPGNSFVPRLWASTTVADLERRPGADRAKIVELSKAFAVPSRHTSLLVLESPAMAAAFNVEPRKRAYEWSGDALPVATETAAEAKDAKGIDDLGSAFGASGFGKGGGGLAAPTAGAAAGPPKAAMPKEEADSPMADEKKVSPAKKPWPGGSGRWVRMRREWFRTASFSLGAEPDLEAKIGAARAAVVAAPDSRDKLEALFGLASKRESLDEARTVMSTWTSRDPLDVPATLRRSELAAREGNRARALRVLTGALDGKPDDFGLADGMAEVALRAGEGALACSLYAVHAEARPGDVEAVARRVACLRDLGDGGAANATLDGAEPTRRAAIEARAVSLAPTWRAQKPAPAWGDLTVDATWSGGADVDLAIVDPKGVRLSWLSPTGVRAADATSISHEALSVPWAGAGGWTVEVTRPMPDDAPIHGTVTVRLLGETRSWPFTLQGSRTIVGRASIAWSSRLVPAPELWEE
ncbi:MAG: FecR domain-containing protein [Deltaproteobacteria bacterium]|nr:FecR domain-containing protein [Deltaproteobacteria bacterium]